VRQTQRPFPVLSDFAKAFFTGSLSPEPEGKDSDDLSDGSEDTDDRKSAEPLSRADKLKSVPPPPFSPPTLSFPPLKFTLALFLFYYF